MFSNTQIDLQDLPQLEEVQFHKLEEDYLWMRLTGFGIFFLVLLGILLIISFSADVSLWIMTGSWLLLLLIIGFVEIRGFGIKGYALRENDVSYKSGLIFFSMTSVPFNRIQHCEVNQGPLARLFDLASVKIYTAGGAGSDLSIGGLKKENAQRLRDHITKLSSQYE